MSISAAARGRFFVAAVGEGGVPVGGFEVSLAWHERDRSRSDVRVTVTAHAASRAAIRAGTSLEAEPVRWLIPAVEYPDPFEERRAATDGECAADEASHPAVIGWTARSMTALSVDPIPARLGHRGRRLYFETPAREWRPGDTEVLRASIFSGAPDPHAHDAVLRALYAELAPESPLNPWVSVTDAAALAADGLVRWHHRPLSRTLAETVAFERPADGSTATGDREDMHVAWLSGIPTAAALLAHARRTAAPETLAAAIGVLDHCAGALAPCGTFWGRWTIDAGWRTGWTPPSELHARAAAEATLFLGRAVRAEAALGHRHPRWAAAVASSLSVARRTQDDRGGFAASFDATSGAPIDTSGTAGLLWTAALAEAGELQPALAAGSFYEEAVTAGRLAGSPEDVRHGVSSEDAYNAVLAYAALHRATGDRRWLEVARRAAAWVFTYRWAYNIDFPAHTLFEQYRLRTRGADAASRANPHLHAYGLVCVRELAELARMTGDTYLAERARDHLACFRQFIARADGDFNARRGMASERWYHCGRLGTKGALLPVSHAWVLGLLLEACAAAGDYPELAAPTPCAEPAFPAGEAGSSPLRRP